MAITTLNLRALNRSDTASSGQVVTATSATACDFQTSSGKIGQVVSAERADDTSISSTSYTDTNCTISITPTATSSKILYMMSVPTWMYRGGYVDNRFYGRIRRAISGSYTDMWSVPAGSFGNMKQTDSNDDVFGVMMNSQFLDSPSTTSECTYTYELAINATAGSSYVLANVSNAKSYITCLEVLA